MSRVALGEKQQKFFSLRRFVASLAQDTGQLFAVKVFSLLDRDKRRQLDREIGTLLRSLENG